MLIFSRRVINCPRRNNHDDQLYELRPPAPPHRRGHRVLPSPLLLPVVREEAGVRDLRREAPGAAPLQRSVAPSQRRSLEAAAPERTSQGGQGCGGPGVERLASSGRQTTSGSPSALPSGEKTTRRAS